MASGVASLSRRAGSCYPVVPPKTGACNAQYAVNFVKQNQTAATQVAGQLGVSPEDILGLSAAETGYGRSAIAQQANNFFSLHGDATAPYATGVRRAGDGPMSVFPSYLASAQSFAAQYGYLVQGKINPSAFANALVPRFNSAKAPLGNPNFVPNLVIVINAVKLRMGC